MNILVNCSPTQVKKKTLNFGLDITSGVLNCPIVSYKDKIDLSGVETVYFSIFYVTHLFNALYFMRKNNIDIRSAKYRLVAGGQGISNVPVADQIFDEVYRGESDGTFIDDYGWYRYMPLGSGFIIEGDTVHLELSRGCKNKCAFCEYGWVTGGEYREKDFALVMDQLLEACAKNHSAGAKKVNFICASLSSYSEIHNLYEFCKGIGLRIVAIDYSLNDFEIVRKLDHKVTSYGFIRICPETFSEKTRFAIGKKVSDTVLHSWFRYAFDNYHFITVMLIYGLPGDDYSRWYDWIRQIANYRNRNRDRGRRARLNLKVSDFEPHIGTPLENAPVIDHFEKKRFIDDWLSCLKSYGILSETAVNHWGLTGRKSYSYDTVMALRKRSDILPAVLQSFPRGAGMCLNGADCATFLSLI